MTDELTDAVLADAARWPISIADAHRMLNLPQGVEYPTAQNKYMAALVIIRHLLETYDPEEGGMPLDYRDTGDDKCPHCGSQNTEIQTEDDEG